MKSIIYCLLFTLLFSCSKEKSNKKDALQKDSIIEKKVKEEKIEEYENESLSTLEINPRTYQQTKLYPYIQAPIVGNESSVYCASFQIAWDKLKNEVIKSPIDLEKPPHWVSFLNQHKAIPILDEKFLVASAGFIKDNILDKIQKELKSKFNKESELKSNYNLNDIIAYAYIQKKINFFSRLGDNFFTEELIFNGKKVDFFGMHEASPNLNFMQLHDYKNDNDFIFEIKPNDNSDSQDEMYFAKVQALPTLLQTYQTVMNRIQTHKPDTLSKIDEIRMPFVSVHTKVHFKELENQRVTNFKSTNDAYYRLKEMIQTLNFSLSKDGIHLISTAIEIMKEESKSEPKIIPKSKKIFFDKPFLIILKEKGKQEPYFLMWVGNVECMFQK